MKEPRTLTVTMLKEWPPNKRGNSPVWLEPGKTYTIDWELGNMLLMQKRAEWAGTNILEMFKL
jgi:hypothetical protein